MTAVVGPGPYCDEDLSDWWVPVSAVPNRMKAAHEVRMCMDDESVVRYEGVDKRASFDLEHDYPCEMGDDGEYPSCTVVTAAWHFSAGEPR